ncbi:MAG TPA: SRPBCC domain-containing protein [Nitrososphaera sp.]
MGRNRFYIIGDRAPMNSIDSKWGGRNIATTENNASGKVAKNTNEHELIITHVFDAPRELVWKGWTDPERVKRWWGPKGFTAPFCKTDLQVGGVFHYCMRSPEGKDYWNTGAYPEIVEPERMVCTDSFADEEGNVVPASHTE